MQTVLIPTDFSVSAPDCIPALCNQFRQQDLSLVFVHLFKLSDSESELLILSRRSKEFELVTDEFQSRCLELKRKYRQIQSLRVEFFYGNTMQTFKNFLEGNCIDYILHPADCKVSKLNKYSIDPVTLVHKCGLPFTGRILRAETIRMKQPVEAATA